MSTYAKNPRDERSSYADNRPPRPQGITVSKPTPCQITANLFKYTGSPLILYQYAVTFTPEILQRNIFQKFLQMVEANEFAVPFAFDGFNVLVSSKKFPDTILKAQLKTGELLCKIEYKHTHNSSDNTADKSGLLQCMEIISRYYQKTSFHVDKKSMFNMKARPFEFTSGLEIVPGLTSTIKVNKFGLYLNLDAVFGVFYKPMSLIDLLIETANTVGRGKGAALDPLRDNMGANFYYEFEKLIKNVKFVTTHRERNGSFKAAGILAQPASVTEFEIEDKKWTVAEYFAKTYKPLKYPHLPLVIVKKGPLQIYLPFEILQVCPAQKYMRKLDENMTSQMIRIAAKRPRERFEMINSKAAELVTFNNNVLKQFGMAFDNKMLNCKGLILPAPQVVFSNNKKVFVNNGSWNLIGAAALQGVNIDDWKIFSFRSTDTVSSNTLGVFTDLAKKYGVVFNNRPQTMVVKNPSEFFNARKAKFNIVVLPDKNAQRYEEIKRIAETYQSVYTQCIVASNLVKLNNPSFVSNLLLKINAKLGGRNWAIDKNSLQDKPTILFGIDVNHPGVTDLESPSIVSIVASMDYKFINYKTVIEQQERRCEIVGSLREHVKSLLKSHYGSTKTKPDRLMIFRDGVGDTMFKTVYQCEIEAIEQACKDLDANYKPEINFIIAQKRHSIRFSSEGNNLVPGTIVDEVGTPNEFDFFLVSHHALQGTARPVRYILLRNDSNFSKMEIYETTYNLCHLYARATKSVSVVPPIYYAHLAAARGKCYLERNKEGAIVMRQCDKEIQKTLYYV